VLRTTDRGLIRKLDQRTAYKVVGAIFSPKYKARMWDGKEHLVQPGKGGHRFPIGLLEDVEQILKNLKRKYTLVDQRAPLSSKKLNLLWHRDDIELRPYQEDAVKAVFEERGLATGKGLLNLPTRSGKTVIAAGFIYQLDKPTLFLVTSKMLMHQAANFFESVFRVSVGRVGDGHFDLQPITVATVQSLMARLKQAKVREYLDSVDAAFFDEVHHVQGAKFRKVLEMCNAYYKVGLSATIFLSRKGENETGTIWLKASTGRILYSIKPSELIEMGYLVQPIIELHKVHEPDLAGEAWSESLYAAAITDCKSFNSRVVRLAKDVIQERGYRNVLIPCKRIEHANYLYELCRRHGLRAAVLIGPTPTDARDRAVKQFKDGDLDVLIGTIFGEGIDIPEVECVINAEGLKSRIAALQRLRNLTPSEGKDGALVIDFMFTNNKYLADHSLARLKEYKRHGAFELRVEEAP